MKVNIYLSYFNGSRYIDEQINSVLAQKNVDVHIYIRDDGSKEEEAFYLNKYEANPQITIIHAENVGYGKSFMWLVKNISDKADFYAFCDQDDVWLDCKLESACKKINELSGAVVYSALPKYVNSDLEVLDCYHTITDDIHYGEMSVDDAIEYQLFGLGCCFVWNNALNDILKKIDYEGYSFPHDNFLSLLASFVGVFYRDNIRPILYRQHEKNASGDKNRKKPLFVMLKSKLKNFNNQSGFMMRKFILENAGQFISDDKLQVLKQTVVYRENLEVKFKFIKYVLLSKISNKKKIKNLLMILGNKY